MASMPPDTDETHDDLTDRAWRPPCDYKAGHKHFGITAEPAEWIVWATPQKPCGCPLTRTVVLLGDTCWDILTSGIPVRCRRCGQSVKFLDTVARVERFRGTQ